MLTASSTCENITASTTNCDYYYYSGIETSAGFSFGEIISSFFLFLIFTQLLLLLFIIKTSKK